ncbi:hypothetical protein Bca4012_101330 [Brassica carinata]
MDDKKSEPPPCPILERIFVGGEEPIKDSVTPYHKPCTIRKILKAFDTGEINHIHSYN